MSLKVFRNLLSFLSSGDASDSICPKGWGMAEWEEDESYTKLFKKYYGNNLTINRLTNNAYYEFTRKVNIFELPILLPFSLIRIGDYVFENGQNNKNYIGYYWEKSIYNSLLAHILNFYETRLHPHNIVDKGFGNALHCVAK